MAETFSGYLLVSDIDGTLLDTQKRLPAANTNAIQSFVDEGGIFTLASGRSVHSVRRIADLVPVNGPVILLNGTQLFDLRTNTVLREEYVPDSYCSIVEAVLESFPQIGVQLYQHDRILSVRMNTITQRLLTIEGIQEAPLREGEYPLQVNKLLFAGAPEALRPLAAYLQTVRLPGMYGLYSEECYYELLPEGISKGTALKALAAHLHIPASRTVAIGDYYNDADMLQAAAISMVPENAPAEMTPYATVRVCHCDDGAVAGAVAALHKRVGIRS